MQLTTLLIPSLWIIFGVESSSHDHRWLRTEVMDGNGLYILDWKIVEKEIVFRVTVNSRGFIGLGFSLKNGKMSDADLVLAWVDDRTGKPTVLVSKFLIFHIFAGTCDAISFFTPCFYYTFTVTIFISSLFMLFFDL